MKFRYLTTDDLIDELIRRVPVDKDAEHQKLVGALGNFQDELWLNNGKRRGTFYQAGHRRA